MKILIVEDDENILNYISKELKAWNYEVFGIKDFNNVTEEFLEINPQLVLMDIVLPYNNGYFWCQEIRKNSNVPIIFLSSKSENMDIIMAMQFGADDYVTKPFDLSVLVAKIKAILRRTYDFTNNVNFIAFNDVYLYVDKLKMQYKEKEVELTKTEKIILEDLFKANGKVVLRDILIEHCWNSEDFIDDNTLSVNITRLRKKFENLGVKDTIKSKRKLGYYLSSEE